MTFRTCYFAYESPVHAASFETCNPTHLVQKASRVPGRLHLYHAGFIQEIVGVEEVEADLCAFLGPGRLPDIEKR